jgi:hypothetical protein
MSPSVAAALIAASITVAGWIAAHYFSKRREDQARKSQAELRHLERQIEELYGPLEGLLTYSDIVYQLEQTRKGLRPPEQEDKDELVIHYFVQEHYVPMNRQIITLLRTKSYLAVGDETPVSFRKFMTHAANLECFHGLWQSKDLQSFFMPRPEQDWPSILRTEVGQTLQELRRRHSQLVRTVTGRKHSGNQENERGN